MLITIKDIVDILKSHSDVLAIFAGAFVQSMYGNEQTFKNYFFVLISSLFIGITMLPPLCRHFDIHRNSELSIAIYALSALISVSLIKLIKRKLPNKLEDLVDNKTKKR